MRRGRHQSDLAATTSRNCRLQQEYGWCRQDESVAACLHPYDPCRKTLEWYRKVVIHLLHISMMNAWIIYKKSGGTKKLLQFHQMVIAQLLFSDDEHQDNDVPAVESLLRLTQKHFPDVIPPTDKKSRAQKRCRVCWARDKVRRDVRYHCPDCPTNPGLCFPACFKAYHTQMEYC
jgi:hypothetical protein